MAKRYLRISRWDLLARHASKVRISFSAEPARHGELALVHHVDIALSDLLESESRFHDRLHAGAEAFFANVDAALRAATEANPRG